MAEQRAGQDLEDVGRVGRATGEIAVDGDRRGDELGAVAAGVEHFARGGLSDSAARRALPFGNVEHVQYLPLGSWD